MQNHCRYSVRRAKYNKIFLSRILSFHILYLPILGKKRSKIFINLGDISYKIYERLKEMGLGKEAGRASDFCVWLLVFSY